MSTFQDEVNQIETDMELCTQMLNTLNLILDELKKLNNSINGG